MKPETVSPEEKPQVISQVSFMRLMGQLKPDGSICDCFWFGDDGERIYCGEMAICRVGNGTGHPSCEKHAQGVPYVCQLQ